MSHPNGARLSVTNPYMHPDVDTGVSQEVC